MLETILYVGCGVGLSVLILVRNQFVYGVRIHFLFKEGDLYQRLPSYIEMMVNPRHWGRWTVRQWRAVTA